MPIDATIPLGFKPPDQMQQLSGLLNTANAAQNLQQNQQKTQQGGIDLQERQGVQGVLADPSNYTGEDGTVDFNKALPAIMKVAPTTGMKYVQGLAEAQRAHTDAQQSLNNLTTDVRTQLGKGLYALKPDSPPDVVNGFFDASEKLYKGSKPYIDVLRNTYSHALQTGGQPKAADFFANAAQTTLPPETQQAMNTPGGVAYSTGTESGVTSTKPGTSVPFGQKFATTQTQVGPAGQEAVETDAQGNRFITTRTPGGAITGTRPLQSANPGVPGPFTLPPNETQDTLKDFQGQRDAARQAAVAAPVMHDINHTIVAEANKGFSTGALGALTQKVASATGYHLGPNESATDYNVLGKMLERSALTAAQSMGPHTNAGLEAAVRANGSLEYTPQALKKIAYLNDALTSGAELYNQGLESAIKSSPNGVFAKRDFDASWSKLGQGSVTLPQVLRLKNAVDNGNQEEVQNIIKEVGGKGTKGAQQLHQQLTKLMQLTGQ